MIKISLLCLLIVSAASFQIVPNAVYTIFVGYYPDANLGGQLIFIRGDSCNLTWNKGVPLNKTAKN